MLLLIVLVISELLTILVFRHHYKGISRTKYYLANVINTIFGLFLWIMYIEVRSYSGLFDYPGHIWLKMSLNGAFCAILVPRILLCTLHYSGWIIKLRTGGGHIRGLTNAGLIIWILILAAVLTGTLRGRRNLTTEFITINSAKLDSTGGDLTIVHISDLHLAAFFRHKEDLEKAVSTINSYEPDLIINTGDFISYGWNEFGRFDTILSRAVSRYGKFAVLGNHDMGTYHPHYRLSDLDTNVLRLSRLIKSSGYRLLDDENAFISIDGVRIGIAGIKTKGRHPDITYGDLEKALAGLDSADYTILLSHDPDHWRRAVAGLTGVDLTLAGHTHGMQMGITTKWFRVSPAGLIFPNWSGLYTRGDQHLYVNRGLGVLAIPFRIGMPPEITVIKLTGAKD